VDTSKLTQPIDPIFYNNFSSPCSDATEYVNPLDIHLPVSEDSNWLIFGEKSPCFDYSIDQSKKNIKKPLKVTKKTRQRK
jgi:hypothetical protein